MDINEIAKDTYYFSINNNLTALLLKEMRLNALKS